LGNVIRIIILYTNLNLKNKFSILVEFFHDYEAQMAVIFFRRIDSLTKKIFIKLLKKKKESFYSFNYTLNTKKKEKLNIEILNLSPNKNKSDILLILKNFKISLESNKISKSFFICNQKIYFESYVSYCIEYFSQIINDEILFNRKIKVLSIAKNVFKPDMQKKISLCTKRKIFEIKFFSYKLYNMANIFIIIRSCEMFEKSFCKKLHELSEMVIGCPWFIKKCCSIIYKNKVIFLNTKNVIELKMFKIALCFLNLNKLVQTNKLINFLIVSFL
jgi:hypothetical protein